MVERWGLEGRGRAGAEDAHPEPSSPHFPVVNSTCSDFNHGSALHIAASNLCLGAAKCLLEHGANPALRVLPPWPSAHHLPSPCSPPHFPPAGLCRGWEEGAEPLAFLKALKILQ